MTTPHHVSEALNQAEDAMTEHVLTHQVTDALLEGAAENKLSHLSPEVLAFLPGLRTQDEGSLGDNTGSISLQLSPSDDEEYRWQLRKNGEVQAELVSKGNEAVTLVASKGGRYQLLVRRKNDDVIVGARQVSLPQFIRISAELSDMKQSLDALSIPAGSQASVWSDIVKHAKLIAHHILRPANFRLIWPDDTVPAAFEPHPVTTDVVLSPDNPIEYTDDDSGQTEQVYGPIPAISIISPLHSLAQASDLLAKAKSHLERSFSSSISLINLIVKDLLGSLFTDISAGQETLPEKLASEPDWYFDTSCHAINLGLLRIGLGGLSYAGDQLTGDSGSVVDQVLRKLASQVDWSDMSTSEYKDFVGVSARLVGTTVARAVLRMQGVPVETGEHIVDTADGSSIVASNILADVPANPVQDLLGLWQPDGLEVNELKAGLDDEQERSEKTVEDAFTVDPRLPDPGQWIDLVRLASEDFRVGCEMTGRTSQYDVLAGIVTESGLDYLDTILGPLPPAYGGYRFQAGDRDTGINASDNNVPVYGGTAKPEDRPGDKLIELLQKDLKAIGIDFGVQDTGYYAYQHWRAGKAKYNGEAAARPTGTGNRRASWNDLKAGNTSWAVREFQIANCYPNRVTEKLGADPRYNDRLYVTQQQASQTIADQPSISTISPKVNGELSVADGARLRQWRFRRFRYPVVVVAGAGSGAYDIAERRSRGRVVARYSPIENIMRTDQVDVVSHRMYVFDKSGYFDADEAAQSLGDYGRGGWRGPHNSSSHPLCDITPETTLGENVEWEIPAENEDETDEEKQERLKEQQRRERFLSVFRVIAAVGEVEAVGHYDGLNAWDNAVFSYPLFHHTLTLTDSDGNSDDEGRPSQMAAFIKWLKDPSDALLKAVFPDAGSSDLPDLPDPYPSEQADVEALRVKLRQKIQQAYQSAFGFFGVGASEVGGGSELTGFTTISGQESASLTSGESINMRDDWNGMNNTEKLRHQAYYQSYQQWFRSWQWFYRFAAPLRQYQLLRTLLFIYEIAWVKKKIEGVFSDIQTEKGRAAYLRVAVRSTGYFPASEARDAVTSDSGSDEGLAITNAIESKLNERIASRVNREGAGASREPTTREEKALAGLLGTTRRATGFNSDGGLNGVSTLSTSDQDDSVYLEVRNDMLRRLVVEDEQ
jgi:hypothetical protein